MQTSRRYQDIAIINNDPCCKKECEAPREKPNPCLQILAVAALSVTIFAAGYIIGVRTGKIPAHDAICCFGSLDFDFDFDFNRK